VRISDGFRFTIQFKNLSEAHRQAGELLERSGNKKSEVILTALNEYIRLHPEVLNKDNPVKVIAAYGISEEAIQSRIEELFKRHIMNGDRGVSSVKDGSAELPEIGENASIIDKLLDGLDDF